MPPGVVIRLSTTNVGSSAVIALDPTDSLALTGIQKAQLQAADFTL